MPKKKNKNNSKNPYLDKFRQTRTIGSYNFEINLRKIKSDSQLSRSQKARITRVYGDYSKIASQHRNNAIKLIKPRHHRGESERDYQKRMDRIRKNETTAYPYLKVIPLGVPPDSTYKIINDQIVIKRARTRLIEYHYPIDGMLKQNFILDPASTIQMMIDQHNKKHPKKPAILVGLATNGFPWKMGSLRNFENLIDQFVDLMHVYMSADQSVNIAVYVSHLIIRG